MTSTKDDGPVKELQRILYVDDDVDIQLVTRFALEEIAGLHVETAGSGAEAVRKLAAFHPDLILLDVIMPDMDGFATLAALKALPGMAEVPVVFVTAATEMARRNERVAREAIGVIGKPFDPLSLPDRLRKIWSAATGR